MIAMLKSAKSVERVEGNVVFLKGAELKHSARDPDYASGATTNVTSMPCIKPGALHSPEPIKDFAKEARLAERNGNAAMRDRICSEGIGHYARIMKTLSEEVAADQSTYKDGLLKTASLLKSISELYGIWGYKESSYSYLKLSENMEELISELR